MTKRSRGVAGSRVGQTLWLILALAGTILWVAGPASKWTQFQTACSPVSSCAQYQLDGSSLRLLNAHGITLSTFAAFTISLLVLSWIIWFGLAALIVWRKPDDRGALLTAYFLVLFPLNEVSIWIPSVGFGFISFVALFVFLLLFPDGRFRPRWVRWLFAPFAFSALLALLLPNSGWWLIPVFLAPLAAVSVQVYRFRFLSTWVQRQQTKWACVGLVTGILGLLGFIAPSVFDVSQTQYGSLYDLIAVTGFVIAPLGLPLCIGIAVLRSRLWDIDRVINRALVYGSLTLVLAGLYAGGVIGLASLFGLVAGGGSGFAVVVTTLAIAALFVPLRQRTQTVIDRRFYRRKYDAGRTVQTFGERVRDEVDLDRISRELVSVVRETLEPEHVSFWLRS